MPNDVPIGELTVSQLLAELAGYEAVITIRREAGRFRSGGAGHVDVINETDKFLDRIKVKQEKPDTTLVDAQDITVNLPPGGATVVSLHRALQIPIEGLRVETVLCAQPFSAPDPHPSPASDQITPSNPDHVDVLIVRVTKGTAVGSPPYAIDFHAIP